MKLAILSDFHRDQHIVNPIRMQSIRRGLAGLGPSDLILFAGDMMDGAIGLSSDLQELKGLSNGAALAAVMGNHEYLD